MSSPKQPQAFRLSVAVGATPVSDVYIEPRCDPKTNKHIVLWKDIQRVFADAKYVLDGEKVVSFMVDDDFNDIVPARILYHPGVVLKVVTTESENLPAALSSSPRNHSTPPLAQQEVTSPSPVAIAATTATQIKPKTSSPAATTSVPEGQSSTSTLPSVTLKDAPSLNKPVSVKDIGKAGADVTSRDTHLDSELAALDINSVPEKSSSKSSKKKKKKAAASSQSHPIWSEDEQLAAEKSLVKYIGCIDAVDRDALSVIIHLIETDSATLQDKASTVLIRLVKDDSVARIVSQDKETVAAIARILQEDDREGQKLTLGAIANLSKMKGFMPIAIQAGLMPTIVRLTRSTHGDFGMRCLTTLQNMAGDKTCLPHLGNLIQSCPDIFKTLRTLLDSIDEDKVGCALMILYNLASAEQYSQEIVAAGTLTPLHKLIQSRSERVVVLALGLLQELADYPGVDDRPMIESGCLERLIDLLALRKSPISAEKKNPGRVVVLKTIFSLLMREGNRKAILDMHLVQRLSSIILKESPELQSAMTQCLLKLSEQVELRPMMLQMGILDTMFQLAKSTTFAGLLTSINDLVQQIVEDHEVVIKHWTTPAAGLRGYLVYLL
ncbi:Vacuolar protein 8 [Mortierella alpina]|nr:Vacuolar protein 8 [Mortierella alpina]